MKCCEYGPCFLKTNDHEWKKARVLTVAHASDFLSLKLPNCGLVLYALEGLECQG
jgi:hypothetical protein